MESYWEKNEHTFDPIPGNSFVSLQHTFAADQINIQGPANSYDFAQNSPRKYSSLTKITYVCVCVAYIYAVK